MQHINQINIVFFITILLANSVGLSANPNEKINFRKRFSISEEPLSFDNSRKNCKINSDNSKAINFDLGQSDVNYLYSILENQQVIMNIEKSTEKLCILDMVNRGDKYLMNYEVQETKTLSAGEAITAVFTIDIKFNYDKYELTEDCLKDIEIIYSTYKQHKEAYIEVFGHTDSKGSESYNKELSQLRADAIKKHLVNKGIPKDQIITKAFGQEQPLAPNINPDGSDNPEGRSKNRRTEVKIVNL